MRARLSPTATPAPYRHLDVVRPDVTTTRRADGSLLLRSRQPLDAFPTKLTDCLFETARLAPERIFLAERTSADGPWARLTYQRAAHQIRTISAHLLTRNLSAERPLVILSGASIAHALLALAAMDVGIPFAAVTPAYAQFATGHAKLNHILQLLTPGLVFVEDAGGFSSAVLNVVAPDVEIVARTGAAGTRDIVQFDELLDPIPTIAAATRAEQVRPGDIAKFLFTSGSTGLPKAVIITNRMWCANQAMFAASMPFMREVPPVFVDWLPWHHTSGGNQTLGMTLFLGGSLYIDDGKPTREGMALTVRNLRDVTPTAYFSVPKGFAELLPYLKSEPALARSFLSSVTMFFYSGASLPQQLLDAMDEVSALTTGYRIPVMSAYGATEAAPFALIANWPTPRTGLAGLPMPGVEAKLIPLGDCYEVRLRGPNITPGYWRAPELTAKAFDEEGFLRIGDTLAFVDRERPESGLAFAGRVGEDFKLTTGTWVNVATLRDSFLKAAGLAVRDIVLAGEGRDSIGGLVFLSPVECDEMFGRRDRPLAELAADPAVRAYLATILDNLAGTTTASSLKIERIAVLPDEPSVADGEVTDKGSISQRRVLNRRSETVSALYDNPEGAIILSRPAG